jgi:hypothetical protein
MACVLVQLRPSGHRGSSKVKMDKCLLLVALLESRFQIYIKMAET